MKDSALARAFADLEDEAALKIVKDQIAAGIEPLEIVSDLQAGMEKFSEQCKKGDFFISDLILAGDIFQQSMLVLEPLLKKDGAPGAAPELCWERSKAISIIWARISRQYC